MEDFDKKATFRVGGAPATAQDIAKINEDLGRQLEVAEEVRKQRILENNEAQKAIKAIKGSSKQYNPKTPEYKEFVQEMIKQQVVPEARDFRKLTALQEAAKLAAKRGGKAALAALPVVGGLASAAMSGDASAAVPLLGDSESAGMSAQDENEMLLKIEEQKAQENYRKSPAGQLAAGVSRGPASISEGAQEASTQPSGLEMEAAALSREGKQAASVIDQGQLEIEKKAAEIEAQRKAQQDKINATIQDIESTKIEPKSFWEGKSTGQKVAAGIGLFFASLTPEGARNAVAIIDREIERDLGAQRANLSKKQNTLSALEKQLGSIDAAESAFRLKALQGIELQLKSTAEKAKGPLARAKAQQGLEQIEASKAAASQKLQLELMKIQAKQGTEKKMGAEDIKRFDAARDALVGIQQMKQALAKGQNTFSLIGDNDFTIGARNFAENFGRMQSGGAISKEEEERFRAMAPGVKDTPAIQQKKLRDLENMINQRIRTLNKDPNEVASGLKGISFKAK